MIAASPQQQARARLVEEKLQALDARFAPSREPAADPAVLAAGLAALPEQLARAEDASSPEPDRLAALATVGALVAAHGAIDTVALRLASLAKAAGSRTLQRAATTALARSRHPRFMEAFMGRLVADDPDLACAAAHTMGVARHTEAVPALVEVCARTTWPTVRAAAAWALGEIGDPRGLEILEAAFRNGKSVVPVIEALGKLGTVATIPLLTVALRDAASAVRLATAAALATLIRRHQDHDHGALVPYLRAALDSEQEPVVTLVLCAALERLGEPVPRDRLQQALGVDFARSDLQGALKSLLSRQA